MATSLVRAAQPEDISQLVALMTEFYGEADYPLPAGPATRAFARLLGDAGLGRVWLVEVDAEAVGYVVLTVCFSMEYGGLQGFVDDLFVRQSHRGSGLATAALAEVRRECVTRGVRALHVEVGPDNETAQRVYRRSGFEDAGRVLLTLPLAPPLHEA